MCFWIFDMIIFDKVTSLLNLEFSNKKASILCPLLLLDALSNLLESLQIIMLWYEDAHVFLEF